MVFELFHLLSSSSTALIWETLFFFFFLLLLYVCVRWLVCLCFVCRISDESINPTFLSWRPHIALIKQTNKIAAAATTISHYFCHHFVSSSAHRIRSTICDFCQINICIYFPHKSTLGHTNTRTSYKHTHTHATLKQKQEEALYWALN